MLHAEHGGGNNSTFATHVVSSTGTDTYSSIAASLGSLKGPRHGGANLKVVQMFDEMRESLSDWEDDEQIADYLHRVLNKEAFDKTGLVYGMGHPVYSVSDPRTGSCATTPSSSPPRRASPRSSPCTSASSSRPADRRRPSAASTKA